MNLPEVTLKPHQHPIKGARGRQRGDKLFVRYSKPNNRWSKESRPNLVPEPCYPATYLARYFTLNGEYRNYAAYVWVLRGPHEGKVISVQF